MTNRGRPKLPDNEKMAHVSVRLPQWMLTAMREEASPSAVIRKALAQYLRS